MVNVLALVISIAALLTSTFFALRQLHQSRAANMTLVTVEMLSRERRTDEFLTSEDFVLHRLRTEFPDDTAVSTMPLEARRHVTRLALYYNSLGQLVTRRAIDAHLVVSTTSYRTKQAWEILEPYIAAERATGNTYYLSHFEHLATLAYAFDHGKYRSRLRFRSLAGRSDQA